MKDRLIVLALAALALGSMFLLLVPRRSGTEVEYARPISTDRRADGLYAAATWLRGAGIDVRGLRARYTDLALGKEGSAARATGGVLLVHVPMKIEMRSAEISALTGWVQRGNTLVVAAALADTPVWSGPQVPGSDAIKDVIDLTGLHFRSVSAPTDAQGILDKLMPRREPERTTLMPDPAHPYFRGVRAVEALSDYPALGWVAQRNDRADQPWLALGRTTPAERAGDGLWIVSLGAGRIVVLSVGSVFTNRALGLADNAALLSNLVTANLGPRGTVWFDDAHQGAPSFYNADALFRDTRLYTTLALIGAVWLVWVMGVQPLAAAPRPRSPGDTDLVRASGGMLGELVQPADAARMMLDRFERRNAPADATAEAKAGYTWIDETVPGARAAAGILRRSAAALAAGRRVPLAELRNAILTLEERLT